MAIAVAEDLRVKGRARKDWPCQPRVVACCRSFLINLTRQLELVITHVDLTTGRLLADDILWRAVSRLDIFWAVYETYSYSSIWWHSNKADLGLGPDTYRATPGVKKRNIACVVILAAGWLVRWRDSPIQQLVRGGKVVIIASLAVTVLTNDHRKEEHLRQWTRTCWSTRAFQHAAVTVKRWWLIIGPNFHCDLKLSAHIVLEARNLFGTVLRWDLLS